MEEVEKWIPVKGFEGLYECSTFGRVKSLGRFMDLPQCGGKVWKEGRILSQSWGGKKYKYLRVSLTGLDKIPIGLKVHVIIFYSFNPEIQKTPLLQIDHIDDDKTNNRPDNLQLLTTRQNSTKRSLNYKNRGSRFVGVSRKVNKFQSRIGYLGKDVYLGTFLTELEASEAYQQALIHINNGLTPFGLQPLITPLTHVNTRTSTITTFGG